MFNLPSKSYVTQLIYKNQVDSAVVFNHRVTSYTTLVV